MPQALATADLKQHGITSESPVAKIIIEQSGEVSLDGKVVSLAELDNELLRLKELGAIVWYHRRIPEQPATDAAMAVLKRVGSARLPIMLFEDPEFKNPI